MQWHIPWLSIAICSQIKRREAREIEGDTLGKLIFVISHFFPSSLHLQPNTTKAFMSSHGVLVSLPHLHYLTINYTVRRQWGKKFQYLRSICAWKLSVRFEFPICVCLQADNQLDLCSNMLIRNLDIVYLRYACDSPGQLSHPHLLIKL
jgi:hypothetical protein